MAGMKRPCRWLFSPKADMSLLLCLGTIGLWARGYATSSRLV